MTKLGLCTSDCRTSPVSTMRPESPDFAPAYNNRGLAYGISGNRQSTIADLQKAADLFQQQGSTGNYQEAIK
jgi:hypothetical protein